MLTEGQALAGIRSHHLFAGLSPAQLQRMLSASAIEEAEPGQVLFDRGQPARHFYVVVEGQVNLVLYSKGGEEKIVDILGPGQSFAEAVMSPEQLGAFKEGKFLTWATFLTDWSRLDAMIADAVRRGAYLNPTLHYEWGGMSRRALQRELEDYRVLSNPDLSYIPRNVVDGILGRQRQIKNFSSRYENTPWISRLPAQDRKEFEAGWTSTARRSRCGNPDPP